MELRQLRYFKAVSEEKSFSRAAQRLHISQPPLSTQVIKLEEELGVLLLERSNRGVALTAAGEVFLRVASRLLDELETGIVETQCTATGKMGSLSIGFISIADYGVLPPALKAYRSAYPGVKILLREMTTDAQIKAIRNGDIDLGIALGPISERDIDFDAITSEQLIAAIPANHPLAKSVRPLELSSLREAAFIMTPRDLAPGLHDLTLRLCNEAGFSPEITKQARQMQTVVSLVGCGMGVALVPSSMHQLARKDVVYQSLRSSNHEIVIGTIRRAAYSRPVVDRFLEKLAESVK